MPALTRVNISPLNKELLTNVRVLPTALSLETTYLVSEDTSSNRVSSDRVIWSQTGLCGNGASYNLQVT